jgi:hypothetical protein
VNEPSHNTYDMVIQELDQSFKWFLNVDGIGVFLQNLSFMYMLSIKVLFCTSHFWASCSIIVSWCAGFWNCKRQKIGSKKFQSFICTIFACPHFSSPGIKHMDRTQHLCASICLCNIQIGRYFVDFDKLWAFEGCNVCYDFTLDPHFMRVAGWLQNPQQKKCSIEMTVYISKICGVLTCSHWFYLFHKASFVSLPVFNTNFSFFVSDSFLEFKVFLRCSDRVWKFCTKQRLLPHQKPSIIEIRFVEAWIQTAVTR